MMSSAVGVDAAEVVIGMRVRAEYESLVDPQGAGQGVRVVFAPLKS